MTRIGILCFAVDVASGMFIFTLAMSFQIMIFQANSPTAHHHHHRHSLCVGGGAAQY
jgi:hypothetical protein